MTPEQFDRLQETIEMVADVFIDEADPRNWSGGLSLLAELDKDTRGDRYWDKKNAIQTGSLLARMMDLQKGRTKEVGDEDAEENKIADYEKEAKKLVDKIVEKASAKN